MNEKNLKVFIEGINRYFNQLNVENIVVSTPYIADNNNPIAADYTGIIGISGVRKGIVYFSSDEDLLIEILKSLGEPEHTEANLIDLVGEVANTMAGNARTEFGKDFDISIPIMIKGAPNSVYLPPTERSFIIPIEWCGFKACLVVSIRNPHSSI